MNGEAHTAASSLTYPVLLLSRSSGVSFLESPSDLRTFPAPLYWKGAFFEGLRIVDAAGKAHETVSASVQRPSTKFGQWLARVFGGSVSVHAETRPVGPISFSELVHIVESDLEEHTEEFEEFSGRDFAFVRNALANCRSVSDLVKVLGGEFDG